MAQVNYLSSLTQAEIRRQRKFEIYDIDYDLIID